MIGVGDTSSRPRPSQSHSRIGKKIASVVAELSHKMLIVFLCSLAILDFCTNWVSKCCSHTFNYSVVVHLGDAAMVAAYRLVEELMMPFEFSVAQSRAQHANSHNPNGIIKNLLVGRFLLFSVNNIAVYKL